MSRPISKIILPSFGIFLCVLIASQITLVTNQLNLPSEVNTGFEKTFATLAWLFGAQLINRILRYWVWEGIVERTLQRQAPRLVMQLGSVVVFFIALSCILTFVFEQSITAFWTASGAIGVVVGFALKNLILDTFSGLAIQMEQPFKVGQWVTVHTRFGEYRGRVEETNWRTTRLWTSDRNIVVVPNSFITTTILTNYSMGNADGTSRFELSYILDFSVPADRAIRVLNAALRNASADLDYFADAQPSVQASHSTPYGIEYKMRYFIKPDDKHRAMAKDVIVAHVLQHLNHAGLTLSYPKTDLYMARMPWRQKDWEQTEDQVSQIAKLSIFNQLHYDDLAFIAEKMQIHYRKKMDTIVTQGEDGDSMFILAEGLLEVLVAREGQTPLKVADLAPGTFFGEKSMLTGEPRSATIACATDVVICEITKSVMSELFTKNSEVAELISKSIARRDMENMNALQSDTSQPVTQNLEKETNLFLNKIRSFFSLH